MKSGPHTKYERLRDARVNAGYSTMAAFARAVGVEEPTYRMHEKGVRGFDDHARKYAEKLGVSFIWLLHGDTAYNDPEAVEAVLADRRIPIAGLAESGKWQEEDSHEKASSAGETEGLVFAPHPDYPIGCQYVLQVRGDGANEIIRDGGSALCVRIGEWPGGNDPRALKGRLVHVERRHPSGFVENSLREVRIDENGVAVLASRTTDRRLRADIPFEGGDVPARVIGVAVAKYEQL